MTQRVVFRTVELGEVITLRRGHDLAESQRKPGSIPIVSSSGITGFHNEPISDGPGIVTGRYGTLGQVHFINEPYWPLNTTLYVDDFRGNEPRYIGYLLSTLELAQYNGAGAVPGINRNVLHKLTVRVPDRDVQRRIIDALSAYDDLIENNQRRIKLLEEAARRLYREWFVALRFPGHERVEVVDGVPQGWERVTLGQLATLNYGKALKDSVRMPGNVPVYGSSGIVGLHNIALVDGQAIIVGRKGNVGSVFLSDGPFFAIDTVYYIAPEQTSFYLFSLLQTLNFISSDSAVPGLNRSYAYSLPVLNPASDVLEIFEKTVRPFFAQIKVLERSNTALKQARDALLPRLMSGALAV